MHPRALLLAPAVAVLASGLAGCSSSGPSTATPPPTPTGLAAPTSAGLPFHFETSGEGSTPTFNVPTSGAYTVAWAITGSAAQPNCTVAISMVAQDGSSRMVVPGLTVGAKDKKSGSAPMQLTPGDWRFQEAGGCDWSVTVSHS